MDVVTFRVELMDVAYLKFVCMCVCVDEEKDTIKNNGFLCDSRQNNQFSCCEWCIAHPHSICIPHSIRSDFSLEQLLHKQNSVPIRE